LEMAEMLRGVIAARGNCDPRIGVFDAKAKDEGRCPGCGQFHLRPGYCQALNPKASEAIASGRALTVEEARELARGPEPELVTVEAGSVTPTVTAPPPTVTTVTHEGATVTRVCEACGTAVEGKARYCSGACRMKAARKRATEKASDGA
jgi:hypothetical protein